jgi:hypothetical protein
LLDKRQEVVDHYLQRQQQSRERGNEGSQGAQEGCYSIQLVPILFSLLLYEGFVILRPRVAIMLFKAPLISNRRSSTRVARAVLVWRLMRSLADVDLRALTWEVAAVTAVKMSCQ